MSSARTDRPLACVMGNLDLVRPLGLAGIRCVTVAPSRHPVHFSRFVVGSIDSDRPRLVDRLLRFGRAQPAKPVLFYESDDDLEFISTHRDVLARTFRFLLPAPELLRRLLDKEAFLALAAGLGLPVPRAEVLSPNSDEPPDAEHAPRFPLVLKPLPHRDREWYRLVSPGKAIRVDSADELSSLWPRLRATSLRFLAQELVVGPETRVESYHVYVDGQGRIAGEFTGRKVRTFPLEFGRSTALESTVDPAVAGAGRQAVERLGLRGVAKLDFKRDRDGGLHLLEVNPRFTLWAHLGARAGVNLPLLAYADNVGRPLPPSVRARGGVYWSWPRPDAQAARQLGVPWWSWLRWTARSEAKTNLSWDDPMPFLRGWALPKLALGMRNAVGRAR
jgi:D-aspartate ligase